MVPGPESNSSFEDPTSIRTEHGLRFSDGTHVPEPKMVKFMPDLLPAMFYQDIMREITFFVNFKAKTSDLKFEVI
jgi:hypothetical protein